MMRREKVKIIENNNFMRTNCSFCGYYGRPASLVFVNSENRFVCNEHVLNNEVDLVLTQDDIMRLDTLIYWGIIKEYEEEER